MAIQMQSSQLFSVCDFDPGAIKFHLENGVLKHNYDSDFALFAMWKDARPFEDEICEFLMQSFDVIADLEIVWTERNFLWNACRLYETPVSAFPQTPSNRRGHTKKIGAPSFRLIVVRDPTPVYKYTASVSGNVEPSNQNVVRAKSFLRSKVITKYRVHSSNNLMEFFHQASLLLGHQRLTAIANGERLTEKTIEKDLEGANGWNSWTKLIQVLNWSTPYLVLRNFEPLPERIDDLDIDFLCDNFQRLASTLGLFQLTAKNKPYKGKMKVGGQIVPTDIRFVGDGYFDQTWQRAVLSKRARINGVYVPREDDHFFTLLHHTLIHKDNVKPEYRKRLAKPATSAAVSVSSDMNFEDPKNLLALLSGYMRGQRYVHEVALDNRVGVNPGHVSGLPATRFPTRPSRLRRLGQKIKKRLT
jgi:hypothetical protein